jgi:hypothetical protein
MKGREHRLYVVLVLAGLLVASAAFAAEEPTSEDFALRVLPSEIVLPASPDVTVPVELEVTVSSAVEGVQGWQFGLMAENSGLETFYIENAREHPDLATIAGDEIVNGGLVPGRPAFHALNFFEAGDFKTPKERAQAPNEYNQGNIEHDTIDGVPGVWAALVNGVVLDMHALPLLPVTEDFGALAVTVRVQGEPPNSGQLVFTGTVGDPLIAVVIVWNGQSYTPPGKAGGAKEELRIPPAVQEPATISFGASPSFVRGDANGDGSINLVDPIATLVYLFAGGQAPGCLQAADADDSGDVSTGDAIHLLTYLFASGPVPAEPFPSCGSDTTPDGLTCERFEPCL